MEQWNAYTRDGKLTDVILSRGTPIPQGLYHLVCEVLVRHKDGSYLCMRRAKEKATYAGYYEATAGGSALLGETPEQCIRRELREETGLHCDHFTEIAFNIYEDGQSMFHSFVCEVDCNKDAVQLQKGETDAFFWMDESAFVEFIASDRMVPTQKRRYTQYYKQHGYL